MKLPFRKATDFFLLMLTVLFFGCTQKEMVNVEASVNSKGQPIYQDKPYLQSFAVKFYLEDNQLKSLPTSIATNRNGHVQVLSGNNLLVPDNGSMFYSGKFVDDISYNAVIPKKISEVVEYKNHIVYLDDKHVFSNAWAGKIQIEHGLPNAKYIVGGQNFDFLVSDGNQLVYLDQDGNEKWKGNFDDLIQVVYQNEKNSFLLVSSNKIASFTPGESSLKEIFRGSDITCVESIKKNTDLAIGTSNGYILFSDKKLVSNVPHPEITAINEIDGELWFGTTWGAYKLNSDGKYDYYAGERWLPSDTVIAVNKGPENSILVLTDKGIGKLFFKKMTLEEKAMFFEKQVREKNIRYGFNCCFSSIPESFSSVQMRAQASDNLWTGMYMASQLFRYNVTGDKEAKQNAYEAFEAMERLHTITGIEGLFARSFERDYKVVVDTKNKDWKIKELLSGSPAKVWLPGSDHSNWTWRSTASSDQAVGQIFALTMVLELADDEEWKNRALKYLDNLMGYIVDNDLYIIDVDGEPTLWGKWNPDYVNGFPTNVGDRRLYSSNIIAFLQTAYKFTGKEKYKRKAYELMDEYGYLENLMRPISEISPSKADKWSETLSHEWNHSDDEMYFLAYWGLYPYAFDNGLKEQFRESIKDHWNVERPEKNALWNFHYAMTGAKDFDLEESAWFLRNYPLDLRNWGMKNSHRKDIELIPSNFRNQSTKELLPLGEIPLYRHNGEIFNLDSEGNGKALASAGDVWLLPYWMGRYLNIISAPITEKK